MIKTRAFQLMGERKQPFQSLQMQLETQTAVGHNAFAVGGYKRFDENMHTGTVHLLLPKLSYEALIGLPTATCLNGQSSCAL